MNDPSTLLGTIAQSSAGIVAIIGGFLVSRLVAISSEREGIKRQLKAAQEEKLRLGREWGPVHDYRLKNSIHTMEGWLEDSLIDDREKTKDLPTEELLADQIPRGSSFEEMLPYATTHRARIEGAFESILALVRDEDTTRLELDDLVGRGLVVVDEDLYAAVFHVVREALPTARRNGPWGASIPAMSYALARITPGWVRETESRRLDESIREETTLRSQLDAAEQSVARLKSDLAVFAQPVGVTSAIVILSLFSVLGVMLPIGVMAFGPTHLCTWVVVALFASFVLGLAAVLGYIGWYFNKIKH